MDDLTIINKMIRELEQAKHKEQSRQDLLKHINNVNLLCELFLEEDTASSSEASISVSSAISEQEIKAMLGEGYNRREDKKQYTSPEHDEANGDSIFDF